MRRFGVVQGRLISSPPGQLQWFPQERWEEEFELARVLGFSYLELIAERQHNPQNPLWSDAGVQRILELNEENGLDAYTFCSDYVIDHALQESTEVVEHTIRLLKQGEKLGMNLFVLPLFEKSELTNSNAEAFIKPLSAIANAAQEAGMQVVIEASLDGPSLARFLDRLSIPHLGCVYDTGNSVALGHDLDADIRLLGERIWHVHLKDKDSARANVLLGTGNVNFLKVFEALRAVGYNGTYTFETYRGQDPLRTAGFNRAFADFFLQEARPS